MAWRCQECDYLGEEIVENELTDEGCPDCGGDCIEFNWMSEEAEQELLKFFEDNLDSFITPFSEPINSDESPHEQLLWENFKTAKEMANKEGVFTYTVIECDGEEAWISKGWHFVNRIGYFFTTKEIEIPEEGLRYW